jgi:hypothetical protein
MLEPGGHDMRHRFLVHELNHTILLVDITEVGIPTEILPSEGKTQSVPSVRFQSWHAAEEYLLRRGTSQEVLSTLRDGLKKAGVVALTVV